MLLQRYHGDGSQPLSLSSCNTYAENRDFCKTE
jgi:hypothetical protein